MRGQLRAVRPDQPASVRLPCAVYSNRIGSYPMPKSDWSQKILDTLNDKQFERCAFADYFCSQVRQEFGLLVNRGQCSIRCDDTARPLRPDTLVTSQVIVNR